MKASIATKRHALLPGKNGHRQIPLSAVVIGEHLRLPTWVMDHASYRRWAFSGQYPEQGWISYLNGEILVDPSMETFKHNQIKLAFNMVIGSLVLAESLGRFMVDRMLLSNLAAGLSTEPDGMFISTKSLELGRVVLKKGEESLEILGTPDMVLEVASKSSFQKDTIILPDLYWSAGISEYWLVDGREENPSLDILRYGARKYVPVRKQDGWVKSRVLGKSFKLISEIDSQGIPNYTLFIR